MSLQILWLKTSPLHPLDRGGNLRSYHTLRTLHAKHHVTYCGLYPAEQSTPPPSDWQQYATEAYWTAHQEAPKATLRFFADALQNALIQRLPFAVSRFQSEVWQRQINQLLQQKKFDLVVCDFLFPAASLPDTLLQARSRPATLLLQHNVESQIWQRRAQHASAKTRFYWRDQYQRMQRFESTISKQFDAVVTVSADDTRIFRDTQQLSNVLGHVPTGVDLNFFQDFPRQKSSRKTLVFLGSMDWHANVDAVLHFAQTSWPIIRQQEPETYLQIVGRSPLPAVLELARQDSHIEVTGTVDDVRPFLRAAHAMVVPLRVGGGTRLKIFEAMAAEIPVISTAVGAEGLAIEPDIHYLCADAAEDFAAATLKVLQHSDFADDLARRALHEIQAHHTWDVAAQQFLQYCETTIQNRPS